MPLRIPLLEGEIAYSAFLEHHLRANIPALFGPHLTRDWPAFHLWSSTSGGPNWQYFKQSFHSDIVCVADCATAVLGDQCRLDRTVAELMDIWMSDTISSSPDLLYIKDWHLQLKHPDYHFYSTPSIFQDDWMNHFYINHRHTLTNSSERDDFRFVYMGRAGTFTPLHRDVYCSYSWSTNIVGRKRWTLFPPSASSYLYSASTGPLSRQRVYDVRSVDHSLFPQYQEAEAVAIVLTQEAGQTIFVPSGWYHQVENLTACISINHNWCNSQCLVVMFNAMCSEIDDVEKALEDVEEMILGSGREDAMNEWCNLVQEVVAKNAGWDWLNFWSMVRSAMEDAPNPKAQEDIGPGGWRKVPPSLRPSRKEEASIVEMILGRFLGEREEWRHISGLPSLMQELKKVIDQV